MHTAPAEKSKPGVTRLDVLEHGPHKFYRYMDVRPLPVEGLLSVEAVVDVHLKFSHPVKEVWRVMRDFNLWHNRYGYQWSGVIAEQENNIVYLNNKAGTSYGEKIPYIVRRVVPERLIYQESLPQPFPDGKGFWTGHNVLSFWEEGGKTNVTVYMEHTFFSQQLSIEELRKFTADLMFGHGVTFWKDFFIADLEALLQGRPVGT